MSVPSKLPRGQGEASWSEFLGCVRQGSRGVGRGHLFYFSHNGGFEPWSQEPSRALGSWGTAGFPVLRGFKT